MVSGVYLGDVNHGLDSPYIFGIWTHGESLRFATFRSKTFTVHEVGFTPGASPTVVKTLPIPDLSGRTAVLEMVVPDSAIRVRFLPFKFRSASVDPSPVDGALVWDARDPATGTALNFSLMSFSSGCRFFACPGTESETHLWRESPTGYVLQGKFASSTEFSKPLLSPNSESIITVGDFTIQLWHTKAFTTTPPIISTPTLQNTKSFTLEFVHDRPLAVFARRDDDTLVVLDLTSGVPQLTIGTGMSVCGLQVVKVSPMQERASRIALGQ